MTGGSSGIGLATAQLLAGRGAKVSLIARGKERLEAAAKEGRGQGG
ncbi:SDR family NAD(P)-dependent oxidoreductase [Streptomyces sp. ME19-01-6]|nr:SDR family NAD(P)-dependent oxidoreductase [Streptomyces sp. ME19-01-6]MDX3226697.1 SDR family NAD(P)-dependent oxidoreductase [Streptomyces sp. ME19-01-6]